MYVAHSCNTVPNYLEQRTFTSSSFRDVVWWYPDIFLFCLYCSYWITFRETLHPLFKPLVFFNKYVSGFAIYKKKKAHQDRKKSLEVVRNRVRITVLESWRLTILHYQQLRVYVIELEAGLVAALGHPTLIGSSNYCNYHTDYGTWSPSGQWIAVHDSKLIMLRH